MQLDSWWYFQGRGGGVKEWEPKPQTIPDGLAGFREKLGNLPFQMHNRHWAANNVYARQNGGDYEFSIDNTTGLAIPLRQRFWDDLIKNKTGAEGLIVYEQDWLYTELQGNNLTLQNATMATTWLQQMDRATTKHGVSIQFCMAYSRFALQAASLASVSKIRVGDDYGPGQTDGCLYPRVKILCRTLFRIERAALHSYGSGGSFPLRALRLSADRYCVYYIGTSSLFAWSLGMAPVKDTWWSTENQPNSPWKGAKEPYSEMLSAVATYSTATVAPGDAIGHANRSLILMTCTKSGTLLQPSRPMTALDACFGGAAFGYAQGQPRAAREHVYPVMSSHTQVGTRRWVDVLSIGLAAEFALKPSHLPLDVGDPSATDGAAAYGFVSWTGYSAAAAGSGVRNITVRDGTWSDAAPITIAPSNYSNFGLHHVAPLLTADVAFLGEVNKWVPVAVARVVSVAVTADGDVLVGVQGDPGETIEVAWAAREPTAPALFDVTTTICTLPSWGSATLSYLGGC